MKFSLSFLLLATAVVAVPASISGPVMAGEASSSAATDATTTTRYVIILKDEVSDVTAHLDTLHLPGNPVLAKYEGAIKGYSGAFTAAAMTLIRADPLVETIQAEQEFSGAVEERFSGYGLSISSQFLRQPATAQNEYYYDHTGAGVVAYVIDSGVQANNPDFGGRAVNAANFITRQYGMADEPNTDTHGHGTAVSGCLGGNIWGIAKQVTIRSVKALNFANKGNTAGLVGAINFAVNDCRGRKCVINISIGGPEDSAINYAVLQAYHRGVTVVVAAGNDNINACHVSPAGSPAVITIGAIDNQYRRADFSNFGPCVDAFAPGVEVRTDSYIYPNQISILINGTSFSSPYVAGIAAYYLSAGLNTPNDVKAALSQFGGRGVVTDLRGSHDLLANNGYFGGLSKKD